MELKEKYGFEIEFFTGDGAYDNKDVHGFVEYRLGAKSLIRVRVIKRSDKVFIEEEVFQRLKHPWFRTIYTGFVALSKLCFALSLGFGYAIRCRSFVSYFKWLPCLCVFVESRVLCGLVGRGFWSS